MFQIPNATEVKLSHHQNVTMEFPAEDWVIISDGTGGISLIKTGKRDGSSEWKVSLTLAGPRFCPSWVALFSFEAHHTRGQENKDKIAVRKFLYPLKTRKYLDIFSPKLI
jgi:hypothetical protein